MRFVEQEEGRRKNSQEWGVGEKREGIFFNHNVPIVMSEFAVVPTRWHDIQPNFEHQQRQGGT